MSGEGDETKKVSKNDYLFLHITTIIAAPGRRGKYGKAGFDEYPSPS